MSGLGRDLASRLMGEDDPKPDAFKGVRATVSEATFPNSFPFSRQNFTPHGRASEQSRTTRATCSRLTELKSKELTSK